MLSQCSPTGRFWSADDFTTLGGGGTGTTTRNKIGRLNADGSLDASFNPGANDVVYALAIAARLGRFWSAACFTMLGGGGTGTTHTQSDRAAPRRRFARHELQSGCERRLFLPWQCSPTAKILVGGLFTTLGGGGTGTTPRNWIGRLAKPTRRSSGSACRVRVACPASPARSSHK